MKAQGRARRLAWLPNAVTSANLLLGFGSVLASLEALRLGAQPGPGAPRGPYAVACWLILWATLGDVLDGKLAKLLKASSAFGMYLDTFADALAFGLAPAVLLHAAFLPAGGSPAVALAPLAYFLGACFRLARYNVLSSGPAAFGFVGLPTPAAALIATSLYLASWDRPPAPGLVAGLLVLLGLAMVSPLRYPSFKGLQPRERAVALGLLAAMLAGCFLWGPAPVMFATFSSFALLWGWCWVSLRHLWVPGVRRGA